jgi:hypothetical protein
MSVNNLSCSKNGSVATEDDSKLNTLRERIGVNARDPGHLSWRGGEKLHCCTQGRNQLLRSLPRLFPIRMGDEKDFAL